MNSSVNGLSVQGPGLSFIYSSDSLVNGDLVTVDVYNASDCSDSHSGILDDGHTVT